MPLSDWAGPITTIASLGAGAIQRGWALKDWRRQNAYNHPKAQVRRLKEAGLPLASMFSGAGGSTSTDVRASEIDPSLGVGKGLEAHMMVSMRKKQLQLMDEEIGKAEAEKVVAQFEANKALNDQRYYLGSKYDEQGNLIEGNRRTDTLELSMREQDAKTRSAEVVADLQRAKTQSEIDHILQTIGLSKENQRGQKIINDINDILTGKVGDGKWDMIQAMIYRFFFGR